jgi:2-haloacid dehalogenase
MPETRRSPVQVREPRYQWLLFDADGTLFDYERAEATALAEAFRQIGVPFDAAVLAAYQKINHNLWQAVEKGELKPGFVKLRRFELLLEQIGSSYSPASLSAIYLECLAACSQLIDDAAETLQTLHGKYRIAILTNGLKVVQRGRLARSAIRHVVSDLIISEEIGFAKPAKEFFDTALARLGNPPRREVLMIGDGWASDIEGAVRYGLDACWYNPARKPRPADLEIVREITALQELVEWLL